MPHGEEIEDAIADAIAQIDVAPFRQAGVPDAWVRAPWPLTARVDQGMRQHLLYSVSIESAALADGGGPGGEPVALVGGLRVVFYYRIRLNETDAAADYRLAWRAWRAVVGQLQRSDAAWSTYLVPGQSLWTPGAIESGGHMPIEVRCGVAWDDQVDANVA